MKRDEILEKLRTSVINGDTEAAEVAAKEAIDSGIDPLEAIEVGLSKGIREVGDKFEKLELFLSDMMIAAEAMSRAVEILEKNLPEKDTRASKGAVVIGTVEGDIHDIGKNIVIALLKANGFKVYDLGKDVPSGKFVEKAEEVNANIIGLSALLSSTMIKQEEVISILKDLKLRDKYIVIVGGAPVTEEWAKKIGADAYGKNANDGVLKIEGLLKTRRGV
ncbi:MAG: corrinoid protein [Candidatus Bathyarchaeia archaeon]